MTKVLSVECRGIAKYGNYFVVASNSHGVYILDNELKVIKNEPSLKGLDVHGVSVYNDKAYIVETKTNSIGVYDLNKNLEKVDEIRVSPEDHDTCHVNDLFIANDKMYVSMFSLPSYLKNNFRSLVKPSSSKGAIVEYSLKEKKVTKICYEGLLQPHSVTFHGNHMYYCVSKTFQVKRNDEVIFNCNGYTRGLALKNQTMIIGQSESRNLDVILKYQTNVFMDCGIYLHNLTKQFSSFIHLPSEEIYGILLI